MSSGGPPILLGSEAKKCFERVVDFCDGWIPINRKGDQLKTGVQQLREEAKRARRRFEDLQLGVFGVPPKADFAKQLLDWGFSHLIFGLPPARADKVLPMLDSYSEIAAKLR